MDKSIKWDESTSQEWFDVVESWPWEEQGGDWVKQGPCPRCGHQMDRTVAGGVAFALPVAAQPVAIWCNCSYPHEQRPSDRDAGCGSNGRISPPPST
jgi:hypothetical protein